MGGETTRVRHIVSSFLRPDMAGLDIGYGGDPLHPTSIALDLENKYANFWNTPQHLRGDARRLPWFADGSLEYVYSSHLLEDFPPAETESILREWVRVVKPGGYVALFLPHEKRYREVCEKTGQAHNEAHQCFDMSLDYMLPIVERVGVLPTIVIDDIGEYSFLIIGRKV